MRNVNPVKLVLIDPKTMNLKAYEDKNCVGEAILNLNETPIEYIKEAIEGFRIQERTQQTVKA